MIKVRRLTPAERIIAWRLASGRFVSQAEIEAAIYGDPTSVSRDSIKVAICRLRKALADTTVTFTTYHAQGWQVDQHCTDLLRSLLAQEIADHASTPYEPKIARCPTTSAKSSAGHSSLDQSSAR